jgi:hypothetical protein
MAKNLIDIENHSCDDHYIFFYFQNAAFDMTSGGKTSSAVPGAVVPDGGWGWVVVFASFMIHFIMDGFVD